MGKRALPIWCEISCCKCGTFVGGTYRTANFAKIRKEAEDAGFVRIGSDIYCAACAKEKQNKELTNV